MEALSAIPLPPGFGFHPTDVELVSHYLKRKILGHKAEFDVIPEVDIYKHEPWDLPAKSQIPTRDCKWHFFTSRDRKYPNGSRSNRATEAGYWKSTGKDRNIRSNNCIIGTKKTLVFHEGKPPYGKRTDWIMHEYHSSENECNRAPRKDMFVLCRITKRNVLTKEDGEAVATQVEENISPCAPLPSTNCPKKSQEVSVGLIPKKEVRSPAENVDDYEEWVTELYDPNFCSDPMTETKSENKVDICSLALKHDFKGKSFSPFNIEATDVRVLQPHGFYDDLGYQFNALEFDDHLFALFKNSEGADGIYAHELGPEFGVDYLSYPNNAARSMEDRMVTQSPTSYVTLPDNRERMIPEDGEESIAAFIPNFTGHQETIIDTGTQMQEQHDRPLCEILSQQIQFQVHKMESRNPGLVNQTFVFVSKDSHLDSVYELNQGSTSFKTKAGPYWSGTFTDSHDMRAQLQEKLTYENSSSAPFSQHVIKSPERTCDNSKPEGPSPKADHELGSVHASLMSMLHFRKLVKPCNPSKFSIKSHGSMSQARRCLKGIGPLLHKCSSAGLNCLFLAACMMGTTTLIAFFLVRDARRFLGTSPAFGL